MFLVGRPGPWLARTCNAPQYAPEARPSRLQIPLAVFGGDALRGIHRFGVTRQVPADPLRAVLGGEFL